MLKHIVKLFEPNKDNGSQVRELPPLPVNEKGRVIHKGHKTRAAEMKVGDYFYADNTYQAVATAKWLMSMYGPRCYKSRTVSRGGKLVVRMERVK